MLVRTQLSVSFLRTQIVQVPLVDAGPWRLLPLLLGLLVLGTLYRCSTELIEFGVLENVVTFSGDLSEINDLRFTILFLFQPYFMNEFFHEFLIVIVLSLRHLLFGR